MGSHPVSYEQLIAYAADELNEIAASLVATHVRTCTDCATTVQRYRTIRAVLQARDNASPSAEAIARAIALFPHSNGRMETSVVQPPGRVSRPHRSLAVRLAVSLALALLFFIGFTNALVTSAQNALPGDSLYPVKTTFENVQLTFAVDEASKTQVNLAIANNRISEISALVDQGRYENIPQAAQNFEHHVQSATTTLAQVDNQNSPATVELARKVDTALSQYTSVLSTLSQTGPAEVKTVIDRALAVSTTEQTAVQQQILSAPAAAPTPVPTPLPPTAPPPTPIPSAPILAPTSTPAPVVPTIPPVVPPTIIVETMVPIPSLKEPSATPLPATPLPAPTNTPVLLPTSTPVPPPTNTNVPPTPTSVPPPTNTDVPPTPTSVPPPTPTLVPPFATLAPPADTLVPPTATPEPPSTPAPTAATAPITPTLAYVTPTPTVHAP